ncbi:hypothetical protein ACFWCH_13340 [Microbacterium sp. NPDC060132]|uniref:hypothetical protein n=1 Tax=unclassified Microbacterium TaxID=2609290 RepID=UPI00109BA796|nr:hypothetical protein [Microbacterium sp. PF5]
MHAFYRETRRVAASVLAGAQLYFAVWNAANHHGVAAVLTTGAPLIAAALLLAAVFVRKRGPLDILAFLVSALAAAVCWGASTVTPDILTYLPAVAASIAFATIALVLRAERTGPPANTP